MISVGVTAVGIATKSKTLMKIGGGLGLGSAAAGMLGLGESAVASVAAESAVANEAAQQAANAAWAQGGAAEAAGVGGAAQEVANASFGQAGINEVGQGVTASALEAGAAPAVEAAAPRGLVESAAAAQPASSSTASPVAGSAPQAASTASPAPASTGIGPRPIADASTTKGIVDPLKSLKNGAEWFKEMWSGLDSSGKLAVGQTASGLVSGIGQGAMQYMAASDQREFQQQQINQRRADRGFVPDLTPYSR